MGVCPKCNFRREGLKDWCPLLDDPFDIFMIQPAFLIVLSYFQLHRPQICGSCPHCDQPETEGELETLLPWQETHAQRFAPKEDQGHQASADQTRAVY